MNGRRDWTPLINAKANAIIALDTLASSLDRFTRCHNKERVSAVIGMQVREFGEMITPVVQVLRKLTSSAEASAFHLKQSLPPTRCLSMCTSSIWRRFGAKAQADVRPKHAYAIGIRAPGSDTP